MVGNVTMGVCSTISTSFCHDAYSTSSLNPSLYGKYEIVTASRISNCIEFGTIKIRIV